MSTPPLIEIAGRKVGDGHPCFVIAEAGVNHNGDLSMARRLIDVAAGCGADAVKFQTFKAEKIATSSAPKAQYQQETTDKTESQLDMLKRLELSADAFQELYKYCKSKTILFLSTPFDEESADLLDELGVAAFKIPSGEITNLPFLTHLARKGKPIILSTGMSWLGEVETAVRTLTEAANPNIALLHCVSNYPAEPHDANLRAMRTLSDAFAVPVGFSDHTMGIEVALAAVALGARVIEKHFTLDRALPGPDHQASLEPQELKALIQGIRTVETALGDGRKVPRAAELNTAAVARKSLVAACDIPANTTLTKEHITVKRPGNGLTPFLIPHLLGRLTRSAIAKDTVLDLGMFR